MTKSEADRRLQLWTAETPAMSYTFYFTYKNVQYAIDSSKEDPKIYGRLVNHFQHPYSNLIPKSYLNHQTGTPGVVFMASKHIAPNQQLFYDYVQVDQNLQFFKLRDFWGFFF